MLESFREHITQYGISPTVGVILMVAITVGLAAVVGVTVFGLGGQVSENTGTIGVSSEQSGSNYTITAQSGQFDSFDYVYVTSTSTVTYAGGVSGETYSDGPNNSTQYLYDGESGGAGTSVTVDTSTASESGQIQVIGVADNTERVLQSYSFSSSSVSTFQNKPNVTAVHANMNGSGTTENPYEISNIYELQAVQEDVDAEYIVVNDIDASGTQNWNIESGGTGFTPIGTTTSNFTGSINGQGYTINGISISQPTANNTGIFKSLNGELSNLTVSSIDVHGGGYVGGIAGQVGNINTQVLTNVSITGEITGEKKYIGGAVGMSSSGSPIFTGLSVNASVKGQSYVGGIAGQSVGSISSVSTSGDVTASVEMEDVYAGGIVGMNLGGTITKSDSTSNINAESSGIAVGGLVGANYASGTVTESSAYGTVTSNSTFTGGAIGHAQSGTFNKLSATGDVQGGQSTGGLIGGISRGTITQSFATGDVTSENRVTGGLIGNSRDSEIRNTYAHGNVSGDSLVGGFAGEISQDTNIKSAYSIGRVTGSNNSASGGFAGFNGNTSASNLYWNINRSNQTDATSNQKSQASVNPTAGSATGLTTNEMKDTEAETNMDFDFTTVWTTTSDYPELQWETSTT